VTAGRFGPDKQFPKERDQGDGPGGWPYAASDLFEPCGTLQPGTRILRRPESEQRFLAADAGTAASGTRKSSWAGSGRFGRGYAVGAGAHEMMLPSGSRRAQQLALVFGNKTVYICFLMAIAMMAASPIRAADVFAANASAAETPAAGAGASTTFVVRADPRTGKLVRRPAQQAAKPAPLAGPKQNPAVKPEIAAPISARFATMVEQSARTHAVDPLLVHAVIAVESNYNANAVSPKGAEGLMQLMPPTARMLGVANSFDPQQNIEAGVRYLKSLQDLYKDDTLALAAYNAGPKAVEKFKSVPPYRETQNYVDQVGRRYEAARGDRAAAQAILKPGQSATGKLTEAPAAASFAAPVQATSGEDQHPKLERLLDENGRLSLKTSP
jgi:hypothetical protein